MDTQLATHASEAMGEVHEQADLDAYFRDMDTLLAAERPDRFECTGVCRNCGCSHFEYASRSSSHPGSRVCDSCGAVENHLVFWDTMYGNPIPTKSSNYKRIHHWHERVSQLLLLESQIPDDQMLQIAQRLCDGSHSVINKDAVRAVLRSLNMQLYIEKWLQIIFRITGVAPPVPGPSLIAHLDRDFQELQRPFEANRPETRKNFLNYNYVFCRLFQRLGCAQFCMFFPLIKSKVKLAQLEETYAAMLPSIGWEFTELQPVTPFAVHLERPDLLLQQLGARRVPTIRPAPGIGPWRTAGPMSRPPPAKARRPKPEPHRSAPPAPAFQKLGLLKKRRH